MLAQSGLLALEHVRSWIRGQVMPADITISHQISNAGDVANMMEALSPVKESIHDADVEAQNTEELLYKIQLFASMRSNSSRPCAIRTGPAWIRSTQSCSLLSIGRQVTCQGMKKSRWRFASLGCAVPSVERWPFSTAFITRDPTPASLMLSKNLDLKVSDNGIEQPVQV